MSWRDVVSSTKALVVGDVMLDRYWFGEVERISPEAPVPVVKILRMEERPGGAANVARNVAALTAQTTLLSVTGDDEPSQALERLLAAEHVKTMFHRDANLPTTVKLRVIGRQQQLLRVDFETEPSREVLSTKLADYERLLPSHDIVVLSDYGKGGLAHVSAMITRAQRLGKRVLIDPKGVSWHKYSGATLLTPNLAELKAVVGPWDTDEELDEKALALRKTLLLEALLVTRSEDGMSLYTEDKVEHIPAVAREVFDVTGAGDTVIATVGTLLACCEDLSTAVWTANRAAGIVVGKFGTAVVTPEELA